MWCPYSSVDGDLKPGLTRTTLPAKCAITVPHSVIMKIYLHLYVSSWLVQQTSALVAVQSCSTACIRSFFPFTFKTGFRILQRSPDILSFSLVRNWVTWNACIFSLSYCSKTCSTQKNSQPNKQKTPAWNQISLFELRGSIRSANTCVLFDLES